jgi:hypothetical protein
MNLVPSCAFAESARGVTIVEGLETAGCRQPDRPGIALGRTMNEKLQARIAGALAAAGLATARNTTTRMRPQWRASFSYRGEIEGEKAYLHVYVPVDADRVQVNCSVPAPAADNAPTEQIETALGGFNASHSPGSPLRNGLLEELGATPADVAGWAMETTHHVGLQHRMTLGRITLPLGGLTDSSIDLAVKLGLRLATGARDALNGRT